MTGQDVDGAGKELPATGEVEGCDEVAAGEWVKGHLEVVTDRLRL